MILRFAVVGCSYCKMLVIFFCFLTYLKYFFLLALSVSIVGLERALAGYLKEPTDKPFDIKTVPIATVPMNEQKSVKTSMHCFNLFFCCS